MGVGLASQSATLSNQEALLEHFFARLKPAKTRVLLLDYDGTLAPFRTDTRKAVPYPGVCELIDQIMENGTTRVVIISGRWTRDLIPLLNLKQLPELWGTHGRERLWPEGRYEFAEISRETARALMKADAWESELALLGARIERKPASLAIHWRGVPGNRIERICDFVEIHWQRLGRGSGLELRQFSGGVELLAAGCTKAVAVDTILDEAGADAVAAYLGDDQTDEDAFDAIKGRGMGVLVSDTFRRTTADIWLRPPQELRNFLRDWINARHT